ncbi:hypothetical protein K788_0000637 [Paraburkholderia caribensis MBA4]|uniref:Uncharacterized protein n=1 Tax=Paraburkholderia caribensis MBA4 TaxID=1323664 RepID=A0A0P0RHR7_9BURK|nr:hypothetical protein K788_0000637 [Paraburkholderia caribensis MBA4]
MVRPMIGFSGQKLVEQITLCTVDLYAAEFGEGYGPSRGRNEASNCSVDLSIRHLLVSDECDTTH